MGGLDVEVRSHSSLYSFPSLPSGISVSLRKSRLATSDVKCLLSFAPLGLPKLFWIASTEFRNGA